jgi:hypothetical protein
MTSTLRIIVTGLIARHPWLGAVTWDYLQFVLGLVRLGNDVCYFEDSGQWPYNLDGGPSDAYDPTPNVAYLAKVMARYSLAESGRIVFLSNRAGSVCRTRSRDRSYARFFARKIALS